MKEYELLRKYIEHVYICEGVDFISHINDEFYSSVEFTDEEVEILNRLSIDNSI